MIVQHVISVHVLYIQLNTSYVVFVASTGYKVSTKKVMIQWIQALLPKWNITNLTSDWRDGRALIAVINKVKPGIAPKVASLDPTKHRKNCAMATNIAHMHLKIPKIITVDDLSSGAVDELSMMTYLSYFVEPFRAKLLKWAQKVLPHFNITGFTSDWFDGQAFAALVDACFPDAVLHWPEQEGKDFVEHIFKIAKRKFGILPPFSALDLASGKVEEMQVMAMITLIKTGELQSLPEEVIVSGPGLGETQLHKETSFFVNTSEAGPGQLGIDAYYEEDGEKQKFSIKERKGRELLLAYTPIRTGKLMFDVTWSDEPVPLSPFVVSVVDSTLVKIVDFESHSRLVEVDKPLKLILDTKRAGKGRLNAYLLYGKKDKIQAMITPAANSRYRLDYTPTKSGSPVLHIFWNKQELAHLAIPYIVVDTGGYCVDSYPRDTVFCTFEEASFTILSSKGLPLDILQMTAVLDYDFQIPIKFSRIEGKKGFASFKPTMPGVYQVEVVCVDRLIQGSPFSVKVTDPTNCKVQGDLPAFLKLNVPHIFEIDTKEAGVGNITFEGTNCEISSLFRTNFQPYDASDLLKLEVTPIAEGDFVVGLKYHKHWIASCPFRLQVCDPRKFKMVEKLTMANVGKPINFTIEAKKVCRGELRPVITATGPSAQYSPQVTLSDDHLRYYVNFIPWEIGDHEIKVCYGTFHIPNSPIKIPVVSFNSNACSAAGSGLQRAYTNIPAQFVVLGKHTGLLENNTLHIKIASVVTGEECKVRVRDNKDGTYNVAYFIQKTGAYLLEIMTAGEHIPGSPFKLNALPGPEPSKCRIYGPALKEGAILTFGKPIDFTVDTTDAGIGKLSVKAVGPEGANARVFIAKTEKAGKYDIDIDALRHGKHRVSVKWSGQHVPNSPFLLKIFPGADASKCQAHGPGLEDGLVGKKSSFVIDTKNAGAGLLKVRLHGIKGAFKIEIQPVDQKNRRTLLAKYDPKQPGEYLIKIMWSDIHIPGSPFRVKITGEGVKKTAAIYTPTPRLPDAVALIEDDEEDSEDSATSQNPLKAILKSAPAIMHSMPPALKDTYHHGLKDKVKAPPHKQKMATFSHIQQMHRIGGSRSSVRTHKKRKRKNEFNGQVSIRMPSKAKSKYTQF